MVANVDAWTDNRQFKMPFLDLPGFEHLRESFVLGSQERECEIDKEHLRVISVFVSNAQPSNLIIYEFALETLRMTLDILTPSLVETVRAAITQMIIAVAQASRKGIGGSGPKVSVYEKVCVEQISEALSLSESASAAAALQELG